MPTREELLARIAELTAKPERTHRSAKRIKVVNPEKERKAKFKLEAWKRAHLHTSLNRYYRS